ncbi:acid ceramidase-like [Lytechinus variegatus]|uniref:acid ceramidase-like n=1 Tax=Lytechinus variegatus TaxID=7654 RepID=UPI001BB1C040|nr:acid ceramidase-like [Lytechinus variegatus]XP_041466348.1 acid ceramidase-like [Lytechinus variegatus]
MERLICILCLVAACISSLFAQDLPPFTDKNCRTDAYPPSPSDAAPQYVFNMDLDPEDRWTELVQPKSANISFLIEDIKGLVGLLLGKKLTSEVIDDLFGPVVSSLREPYDRELQGIADATGIPIGEIVLMNIFYEIESFCTAVIAQTKSGDIYHARNMDFGTFLGWDVKTNEWIISERLKPLVTNVEYQKGGKVIARAVHFAGYVGILTGLKPGVVSLNINARHKLKDSGVLGFIEWILGDRKPYWTGFALRDAILMAKDFNSTVEYLSTVDTMVPSYLTVGGMNPGEGVVITKAQGNKSDAIRRINVDQGNWFLVQTNYDSWKNAPWYDDRRDPAIKCMKNMTQPNVSSKSFFNVLSTKPVLNMLTTFTALMHVREGTLEAYIRHCPQPCFPW